MVGRKITKTKSSGKVYKSTSKTNRAKSFAKARKAAPKKVAPVVKRYIEKKLDARIPDQTFTQRRDYYTNSGITNADLYPLLGYSGTSQHFGINIPHNLVRPSEDDGSLNSTLDQHFARGVRLKSLRIKGELSLPSDWFVKGRALLPMHVAGCNVACTMAAPLLLVRFSWSSRVARDAA